MAAYGSTRNVDMAKQESDLSINIRKATSIDETAPKRKHVRACIVYTWDHKSSQSFWAGMKVQPILADEVQTFKALITIHKVLQEGHPIVLKEAQANVGWLESLRRGVVGGEGIRGYGKLIEEYIYFLKAKLAFHRQHPEFNGTFEYEEYISLKSINDPNEGYETITDMMTLQDQIDTFQKLIFAHIPHSAHSECRISALVPLVQESYGIYKFITSMLRAMHTTLGDDGALQPLRERYDMQHYRLVKFYYECSQLRYLTSLITVPRLPGEPPSLLAEDEERPSLPSRPVKEVEKPPSPPPSLALLDPEPISEFWKNQQIQEQNAFAEEQKRLQEQWEAARRLQEEQQLAAQREYEQQQRRLAEQQRLEQERLAQQQIQQQTYGRLAELERENQNARAQWERDQLLLEQYDRKMKSLETELGQLNTNYMQQMSSKDDQIATLMRQLDDLRQKYDRIAKLYSELRNEHFELLAKMRGLEKKAASAQEAIDQREKFQRDLKQKNLDLANMIRERDRARMDLDRLVGGHREELEKLKRELRFAEEKAENAERSKGSELSAMLNRHTREIADLEETLRQKQKALDEAGSRTVDVAAYEKRLREKDDEIEIFKMGMDQVLSQVNELRERESNTELDGQVGQLALANFKKISDIVDELLKDGIQRLDDAIYELDSPLQTGNQNATGSYVNSQIERASQFAHDFSVAFGDFLAYGTALKDHSKVVHSTYQLAGSIADVLSDTKGISRFASDERKLDQLITAARYAARAAINFFRDVQSFRLADLDEEQKQNVIVENNVAIQQRLSELTAIVAVFAPKDRITNQIGDLGEMVDQELTSAAKAIEAAAERLEKLKNKPRDSYSTYELKIHDSILEAAIAVTNAIAQLIKAATESQQEIVAQGRGTSTRAAFYKRHNRWTEGLISAAKAVATSTNGLIETADGVISGRNSPEQLIVSSNDVAASTAQLVAASRVKASLMSKTQERLEVASRAVTGACKNLVKQVQDIIAQRNKDQGEAVDYSKLTTHELKTQEMEQQVEILKLENALTQARTRLGEMRKLSYQEE